MKHSITYLIITALLILYSVPAFANLTTNANSLFFNTTDNKTITGAIEVTNNGNETINIVFSSNSGLNLTLPQESNLTANQTKNFSFLLALELFKPPGTYGSQIIVKKSNNYSDNSTVNITALVNERKEIGVSEQEANFVLNSGNSKNKNFTIINKGNVPLTNITISSTNNNSLIVETFSNVPSLGPGGSASVNWNVETSDSIDYGNYLWKLEVKSGELTKEINANLKITFSYCSPETSGSKLKITLDEPDSSDDFKIGEKAKGEVTVKNNWNEEIDVVVKALLYNLDKNKVIEDLKIDTLNLEDSNEDSLDFEFDLESSKIDPEDEYRLYVKAYEKDNEENECREDSGRFYLDIEEHEVIINSFELTPSIIDCGDLVYLEFEILNIGKKDEDDVTVEIKSAELEIDEKSDKFDLKKSGDDDSSYTVRFVKQIPENLLSGEYLIKSRVFYNDDGDMYTENYAINLDRCKTGIKKSGITSLATAEGGINLEVLSASVKTKPGKTFVIPVSIKNNGALKIEVDVEITNAENVGLPGIRKTLTLIPGHSTILYLDMVADSEIEEGKRSLTVNVKSNGEVVATSTVVVDVVKEDKEKTNEESAGVNGKTLGEAFGNIESFKGGFWFFGDILLILLAVFLVRSIFRRD